MVAFNMVFMQIIIVVMLVDRDKLLTGVVALTLILMQQISFVVTSNCSSRNSTIGLVELDKLLKEMVALTLVLMQQIFVVTSNCSSKNSTIGLVEMDKILTPMIALHLVIFQGGLHHHSHGKDPNLISNS